MLVIFCTLIFSANAVMAENERPVGSYASTNALMAESAGTVESYTDTDKFYINKIEYDIRDYAGSMHNQVNQEPYSNLTDSYNVDKSNYGSTVKYAENPDNNRVMSLWANDDDAITQIIPDYLFKEVNDGIIHIGKEYGFFIKTEVMDNEVLLSSVILFDFSTVLMIQN